MLLIYLPIYLPKNSSRCLYVFDLIFKDELGIEFQITDDIRKFENYPDEKISYSGKRIGNEFFIRSNSLLFETEIKKQEIKVVEKDAAKILFPNEEDDLGFDIFSSVFFLVSRYEEYLPFSADKFGRFKASDTLAFQNNFLEKPLVNIWIEILKKKLQKRFSSLKFKKEKFQAVLTYDIDVAYKFKGRNFGRNFGSALKDILKFRIVNISERIQTLFFLKKDPWDVYDELQHLISHNQLSSVFFFLLADKTKHDRNLHYQNHQMKQLVNQVKAFSEIGIHPSFFTSVFPEKILVEKERLENLSGKKITKSRQHYLKFILPETYNSLLEAGISEDYSMGFSGAPGFRAGTCKPFYFYDLKNEKVTTLKIFPITFMESSVMNIAGLNYEEKIKKIFLLLREVREVNGTFISLWHNHTISDKQEYSTWRKVHETMIQQISSIGHAS